MQAFDSARHNHLLPIRALLQSWWDNRPSDVIGLALYGSRAKNCAEQYSDWDIVIFTNSENPDEDAICRNLPRDYADAPIHALCESIEYVKSEAKYGGSLMSAIAEQGVSLFGATVPFEEDTIKHPSFPHAQSLFGSAMDALLLFLVEANVRFREKKTFDNTATSCSANAAEYLVKSFMSARGINYLHTHNVKNLCTQFAAEFPNDPLVSKLRKLDGFTTKGHKGPYRSLVLPMESLRKTTERVLRVLDLLPMLASEIFSEPKTSKEMYAIINGKLSALQESTTNLVDPKLKQLFQKSLDMFFSRFN
ncbi:MAG: HEPN domain-containing protein [Gammaproteobacteria bacterium]|nr:HEPN domain-containing protein [Gammaproteobacteria bacterium]MYF03260.1 HEPN domain-containing protein [Gammaproteobacteria bacterium]